jgi:hypothetical protein
MLEKYAEDVLAKCSPYFGWQGLPFRTRGHISGSENSAKVLVPRYSTHGKDKG